MFGWTVAYKDPEDRLAAEMAQKVESMRKSQISRLREATNGRGSFGNIDLWLRDCVLELDSRLVDLESPPVKRPDGAMTIDKEQGYRDYIDFLTSELSKHAGFLHAHGFTCSDELAAKGTELRNKIGRSHGGPGPLWGPLSVATGPELALGEAGCILRA